MVEEVPGFLKELKKRDREFGGKIIDVFKESGEEGVLDRKTKTLISMALDAALGHPEGVKALAEKARAQGATEKEIHETVKVVTTACGIQGLATASEAFKI